MSSPCVIGVDFGSDSVRAILVNAINGEVLASRVSYYPRWKEGLYCNPSINQFRQHPLDYLETLEEVIRGCIEDTSAEVASRVVGISVDTTGSTPVAVNREGVPLALTAEFKEDPNAMFVLWKDHTAIREASEINQHAKRYKTDYLKYVGGVYSSEWFWAKMLHVLREDEKIQRAAYTWVEHCDWIPYELTGGRDVTLLKRGVCAAGHKGLWAEEFNGYPPNEFFTALDPLLKDQVQRLGNQTYTSDQFVGKLSYQWAEKLGLSTDVVIGVGAFDCHMGAVGGEIEPYYLSKIVGTSTCDILVAPEKIENTLKGICGQVNGSVIPNMVGLEAGQSAFGDAYAWFKNILMWPLQNIYEIEESKLQEIESTLLSKLSEKANVIVPNVKHPIAIDWLNGRRTPFANQNLKSSLLDLNLASDTVLLFRAVVESTCFGARKIAECFIEQGVPVKGIIAMGGIPKKSPFIMQMMADILNMPIKVHKSDQTCALGAAMFAAVAAKVYPTVEDAMRNMGHGFEKIYSPNKDVVGIYQERYDRYLLAGDVIENNLYDVQ
ncbi:ribulokinase [Sphingobacterium bovistauri]|uniref:Ribulokinase n=1 Tax=Sphingobacterium bovistauri TaxID=2781959 RepID=A0ABS7Z0U9_9SPHI|nr:ribulokinase [Sphingobacterium bovistauri]MCA5003801.1 ribulokinase [Sphingobacterium bovistauri]